MSASDAPPDDGAVQQLAALFHSADPAQSGLLSFSEFAYLILKSGGSQEQVDALIDQFSVPGRAQRMVCYAALLQQLTDSLAAPHQQQQQQQEQGYGTPASEGPRNYAQMPPQQQPLTSGTAAAFGRSAVADARASSERNSTMSPHLLYTLSDEFRRGTTLSPLSSSANYPDGRTAGWGRRGGATARDVFVDSYSGARTQGRDGAVATPATRSRSGSAPRTPFHLSSRFVASAVRTARQQGSTSISRSRSASGYASRSRSVEEAHEKWCSASSTTQQPAYRPVEGASPVKDRRSQPLRAASPLSPPPRLLSSGASSIERMTRAARAAQRRVADDTPRDEGGAQSTRLETSIRHSSHHNHSRGSAIPPYESSRVTSPIVQRHARPPPPQQEHDSVLSSASVASTASKPVLLSLRDVFQQHVLPSVGGSRSCTVLVSELEEVFAARGIDVHPLELEAVFDSLELTQSEADQQKTHNCRRGVSAVNTSTATSTATMTGGADGEVGLVDFCVLVSRLRPSVILRLRSPATWKDTAGWGENGGGVRVAAAPTARRGDTTSDATRKTPQARKSAAERGAPHNAENEGNEDEDDEASIMNVTVSPMTPSTSGTTPQSHRGGRLRTFSSPRSQQQQRPWKRDGDGKAFRVDVRRPLMYRPPRQQQTSHNGVHRDDDVNSPMEVVEETPPTARQLSADRHFTVRATDTAKTPTYTPPSRRPSAHGGYARPTASSGARQRPQQDQAAAAAASAPSGSAGAERRYVSSTSDRNFTNRSAYKDSASPRKVHVSVRASPPQSEPARPRSVEERGEELALPLRLVDALQRAATLLLLRCTQLDSRHTGCIPSHAWANILRECCPSFSSEERCRVEAWLAQLRRRHTSVKGEAYAEVVCDILTYRRTTSAAATAAPARVGLSPSSTESWSPSYSNSVTPASPASTANSSPYQQQQQQQQAFMERAKERIAEVHERLKETLLAVCGGDTEALHAYFEAFDATHTGYLQEHVWRASLEELFSRTMACSAPQWVLEACHHLARLPFDSVAAHAHGGAVEAAPTTAAERAACARVRRLSPARPGVLCDYRFVLQELGLST